MIRDKQTLRMYLDADKYALGIRRRCPGLFGDDVWKYQRYLRKYEFYFNTRNRFCPTRLLFGFLLHQSSLKLGFSIGVNCIGPGLRINHHGLITINSHCRIGKWCDIHQGVNIGDNGIIQDGKAVSAVPTLGDYCFIGPGAKVFGGITIGDECRIGANSVVTKSVPSGNSAYGVPAECSVSNKKLLTIASKEHETMFLEAYPQYKGML